MKNFKHILRACFANIVFVAICLAFTSVGVCQEQAKGGTFIVVGAGEGKELLVHAAGELANYVEKITGVRPEIVNDADESSFTKEDSVFVIGAPSVNTLAKKIETDAGLKCPIEVLIPEHQDGFVIRSWRDVSLNDKTFELIQDGPSYVVFAGRTPIATLYAVYHYLDYVAGCGFFEDGERIPKLDTMPVNDILIIEKPVFDERIQLPWDPRLTLPKGVSCLWRADFEWKDYLDWMAKNKFNWMRSEAAGPFRNGYGLWHKMYPDAEIGKEGEWCPAWWQPEFVYENTKKALDMARFRGIKIFGYVMEFCIPSRDREIVKKYYPNVQFTNPDPVYPMWSYIRDLETLKAFFEHSLEEYPKHYGKIDLRWASFPPEEMNAFLEAGTKYAYDRSNFMADIVKKYDPNARFVIDGWGLAMRYFNNPAGLKELVDKLTYSYMFNSTYPCRVPMYWKFDYFWGKPWHYTDITAFGGMDHLHYLIPLPDVMARAKDVATNPNSNCIGFGNMDELIGNDPLIRYAYSRLSWNPFEYSTWNDLLVEYVFKRYGPEAFSTMYESYNLLTTALFVRPNTIQEVVPYEPVYKRSGDRKLAFPIVQKHWNEYVDGTTFKQIEGALVAALLEAERFNGDMLYEKYLSRMFTTYVSEAYKFSLLRAHSAYYQLTTLFKSGVTEGPEVDKLMKLFEDEAAKMDLCLGAIERVWSTRPELSTEKYIKDSMSVPDSSPLLPLSIRLDSVVWCDGAFETMAQFYRPRSAIIVDGLRQRLARRDTELFNPTLRDAANLEDYGSRLWKISTCIDDEELMPRIEKLIDEYVTAPIHVEGFKGTTTDTVIQSFKELKEKGCTSDAFIDMMTTELIEAHYPFAGNAE